MLLSRGAGFLMHTGKISFGYMIDSIFKKGQECVGRTDKGLKRIRLNTEATSTKNH